MTTEDRVRAALAWFAVQVQPRPALSLIRTRTNGAPAATGTPPNPTAEKEPKDMETLQRQAQQLQPGDIITAHPDHPERQVWYRVATWPRRITPASVLIDYTCRPEQVDGEACGVLMLDLDQPCTVVPAHACGGVR